MPGSILKCSFTLLALAWSLVPPDGVQQRLVIDLHLAQGSGPKAPASLVRRPQRLRRGLWADRSNSNGLYDHNNVLYTLRAELGDAAGCVSGQEQSFQLVPDTGSSDLWVPSWNCSDCPQDKLRYDPVKSCTARASGHRANYLYGDGTSFAGVTIWDTVRVGALKVRHQSVIQVEQMTGTKIFEADGILGLGRHPQIASVADRGQTFLATLFMEHLHLPRHFSLFLTDGGKASQSHLIFGDPDIQSYSKDAEFQYGKLWQGSDLWVTTVRSVGLAGKKTCFHPDDPNGGSFSGDGQAALVDSGSSVIVLVPDLYDSVAREIGTHLRNCRQTDTEGLLMCDCPSRTELPPPLVIGLVDVQDQTVGLCMSPDEYLFQLEGKCIPAVQRGSDDQPAPVILGMAFIRSFYTTFDLDRHLIGFARNRLSPLPGGGACPCMVPGPASLVPPALLRQAKLVVAFAATAVGASVACYFFVLLLRVARGGSDYNSVHSFDVVSDGDDALSCHTDSTRASESEKPPPEQEREEHEQEWGHRSRSARKPMVPEGGGQEPLLGVVAQEPYDSGSEPLTP